MNKLKLFSLDPAKNYVGRSFVFLSILWTVHRLEINATTRYKPIIIPSVSHGYTNGTDSIDFFTLTLKTKADIKDITSPTNAPIMPMIIDSNTTIILIWELLIPSNRMLAMLLLRTLFDITTVLIIEIAENIMQGIIITDIMASFCLADSLSISIAPIAPNVNAIVAIIDILEIIGATKDAILRLDVLISCATRFPITKDIKGLEIK